MKGLPPPIFLKWAGGKRLLSQQICSIIAINKPQRYIEPFLGGGAVFFDLLPDRAFLSDINPDLINTYIQIQQDPDAVKQRAIEYFAAHSSAFYYELRSQFNAGAIDNSDRAAAFLYLNRASYNGLWRTNSQGEMNSPVGDKLARFDFSILDRASKQLDRADIMQTDFEQAIAIAGKGDCIYCDPPYYPINQSGFTSYSKDGFTNGDRIRLAKALHWAIERGADIILSDVDCDFIRDLYQWNDRLEIRTLDRVSRAINPKSKIRSVAELLIFTS